MFIHYYASYIFAPFRRSASPTSGTLNITKDNIRILPGYPKEVSSQLVLAFFVDLTRGDSLPNGNDPNPAMILPKEAVLSAIRDSIQNIEEAAGKKISKLSAYDEPRKNQDEDSDSALGLVIGTVFGILLFLVIIAIVVKIVK